MRYLILFAMLTSKAYGQSADLPTDDAGRAAFDALRGDVKRMPIVYGAAICTNQERHRRILSAIAREHRYAKQTGVLNLQALERLKESLKQADEAAAGPVASLKRRNGMVAASCNATEVKALLACRDTDTCAQEWYVTALPLVPEAPGNYDD